MKKKVLLSVLLLASCLSLGSCRIVGLKGDTGPSGAQGEKGENGEDGKDGESPTITISDDGYWVINGVKSNVKAAGEEGQKGDTGEKGDSGEPGTKWIYDQGNPIDLNKTSNEGDFYFDTDNGNVFTYTNFTWNYVTNFRYKIDYNENHGKNEFTVYSMDQIEAALAAVKDGEKLYVDQI